MRTMRVFAAMACAIAWIGAGLEVPLLAQTATVVSTDDWRIYRPSRQFKDLPALRPRVPDETPNLGLLSFVCRKTDVFMLLTQPAQAMDSNAPVQVAIGNAAPIVVRFQNLYASKAPLSRQIDWDAEIYFAEATPALVAALEHAERMQLDFGGRTYVVNLDNFARRWPIFRTYCATGAVRDPGAFGVR